MKPLYQLLTSLLLVTSLGIAHAETLEIVGFNVESGGAQINTLSDQVKEIASTKGVDIWGFSEVQSDWADALVAAAAEGANANFAHVLGTTGGADRLLIVYNADRFELIESSELHNINPLGRVRAPLVTQLKDALTGKEFLVVVNHLYRSQKAKREQQAKDLNAWTKTQTLPVIAVGDYNFDWAVVGGDTHHGRGFDNMTDSGIFEWLRPATLVRTHCSNHNGVLDFVFVSGDAQSWSGVSEIIPMADGYCTDYRSNSLDSDHRPVFAQFDVGPVVGGPSGPPVTPPETIDKAAILQRLQEIRAQLDSIEAVLQ